MLLHVVAEISPTAKVESQVARGRVVECKVKSNDKRMASDDSQSTQLCSNEIQTILVRENFRDLLLLHSKPLLWGKMHGGVNSPEASLADAIREKEIGRLDEGIRGMMNGSSATHGLNWEEIVRHRKESWGGGEETMKGRGMPLGKTTAKARTTPEEMCSIAGNLFACPLPHASHLIPFFFLFSSFLRSSGSIPLLEERV
jgi:hypothetical protein